MLSPHTLQLVREQLKIKTRELKKQEKEKAQLNRRLHRVVNLNKEKIRELQALLDQKDRMVKEAKQVALAARVARHSGLKKPAPSGHEPPRLTAGPALQDLNISNDSLQRKSEASSEKESLLKKQMIREQKALDKANRDKSILIKELKRIRKELQTIDNLNEQITRLKADLKRRSVPPDEELEQRLRQKDQLIENYEKLLKETSQTGKHGLLPHEAIIDLKMELNELKDERNKLAEELEEKKEYIAELEMKAHFHDEKDTTERLEGRMTVQNRAQASSEFSSGLESFLVTYSDMITLILVIFVLLFTVSKVDENRFAEAFSSFQEKEWRIDTHNIHITPNELVMLRKVKEMVRDNVDPETLIRGDVRDILIRLKSGDLFRPGRADLLPGGERIIREAIDDAMQEGVKQIHVEGHTDDVPIKTEQFPSNWELSAARASRVARFIVEKLNFPPNRIVVKGYGEYRPFKPNTNDQNRAMNRRVDIRILKDLKVYEEERRKGKKFPVLAEARSNLR